MEIANILQIEQFSMVDYEKQKMLCELLKDLNQKHLDNSSEYKAICDRLFPDNQIVNSIADLPFLPVSVFKNHILKSIDDENIFKVLTSSGTTGQNVSKIYLDKDTSKLQTLALSKIISCITGSTRLPMLIVDSKSIFSNKASYSARGAGILGLSVFGKDHTYILDDKFNPDEKILTNFLEKYSGHKILIFGFTFMIWQYLMQSKLQKKYDLSKAILLHSGGWKKLTDIEVSNEKFKQVLKDQFGLEHIYNFYGMVEQVGSVFIENSDGNLHCPNFADIIIRNPIDFSVQKVGEKGLIQVVSPLALSYPGHSLLTEDIGVQMGVDDASNGWSGKYFKILGRAKKAELRGCSDTFNK
jgi:hypothetical protein